MLIDVWEEIVDAGRVGQGRPATEVTLQGGNHTKKSEGSPPTDPTSRSTVKIETHGSDAKKTL